MFLDKSWDQFIKSETQEFNHGADNDNEKEISSDSDSFYSVEKNNDDIEIKITNIDLISRIKNLNQKEKFHILSILKSENTNYTKNSYGYFFNLSNIDNEMIKKIIKSLELIEMNRDIIKEMDKKRSEMIAYYKKLIEDKIKNSILENNISYYNKLKLQENPNNIYSVFTRIKKFKKKILVTDDDDIDIIIKNYKIKYNNYLKGSVYSDIIEKMKKNNKYVVKYVLQDNVQHNYDLVDDYNIEYVQEIDEEILDPENQEENYDNNNDIVQEKFIIDDKDYENDEDIIEDEYQDDKESYEYNSEEKLSTENDKDINDDEFKSDYDNINESNNHYVCEKSKDQTDKNKKLMFYKNLLFKHGFVFKQNSSCELVFQPYID
jgi:hypothetical protein